MNKIPLTEQQKKEIYELYIDPSNKVTDIASTYGVTPGAVTRTAYKLGAPARLSGGSHDVPKTRAAKKTCPNCKVALEIKGARFCYMCGSDVRSPKELLIERIVGIRSKFKLMPENVREELSQLLIDIQTELKG